MARTPTITPSAGDSAVAFFAASGRRRATALVAGVAVVVAALRWGLSVRPDDGAVLSGALVGLCVGIALWRNRSLHILSWRAGWTLIGAGLVGEMGGVVARQLGDHPSAASVGLPLFLTTGASLAVIAGVLSLIHQRLPERSVDSLAEAVLPILALDFAVLALAVAPTQGWYPATQLPAIITPSLDIVALWLVCSLVSLTERHPVSYRFLIGGLTCVFAAHATESALALAGVTVPATPVEVVALVGVCLWAVALLHPSLKTPFDPVPLRAVRKRWLQLAMIVAVALVVPAALSASSVMHVDTRSPGLLIGSSFLPLLLVLYLVHQIFTHAAAEYRAQHDPLTGICNRPLFEDRLRQAIVHAERTGGSLATMFMDLDRFKEINDSLGHAVGNELLKEVVKRLRGDLREQDILARFGGDEFVFLFPDGGEKEFWIPILAQRVLARFDQPFIVRGRQLTVKASIGAAAYPWDGADADTLIKHADTAMYQAKAAGRNTFQIFDSAMSARARLRFALEDSLRSAVEGDRLVVHYQPKLSIATGEIVGVEALARWRHPHLGFIPPWAFIPLAEETSLVASLGEWVLVDACRQAMRWQEQGLRPVPVAVNLSPRQFAHQPVVEMVTKVLEQTGLDPTLLELEVTESVIVERVDEVTESLNALRAMGVRCSIDDFGTGYSALNYLAEMPIDAIKIDSSFVQKIDGETSGAPIVGAVIALAHSLGLVVVAEGVETDAQLSFLESHGCDQVQGFRFSPPVPAEEVAELLHAPAGLFTAKAGPRHDDVATVSGGISPARLSTLLESIMLDRRWPTELDTEAIEQVLAALHTDTDTRGRPRPARPAATAPGSGAVEGGAVTSSDAPASEAS